MLQMTGRVINVFMQSGGVDKDGKEYEPRPKVQLLGETILKDGTVKNELIDLSVDNFDDWKSFTGKEVVIDVGVYAPAKNTIYYSVKQNSKPILRKSPFDSSNQSIKV